MNQRKFKPGKLVITPAAADAFKGSGELFVLDMFLNRHLAGDWGEMSEANKQVNELGLKDGDRNLHSAFTLKNGIKIWIITEWDRSVTTAMLPEDY